jgi:hypothetical protein
VGRGACYWLAIVQLVISLAGLVQDPEPSQHGMLFPIRVGLAVFLPVPLPRLSGVTVGQEQGIAGRETVMATLADPFYDAAAPGRDLLDKEVLIGDEVL